MSDEIKEQLIQQLSIIEKNLGKKADDLMNMYDEVMTVKSALGETIDLIFEIDSNEDAQKKIMEELRSTSAS